VLYDQASRAISTG